MMLRDHENYLDPFCQFLVNQRDSNIISSHHTWHRVYIRCSGKLNSAASVFLHCIQFSSWWLPSIELVTILNNEYFFGVFYFPFYDNLLWDFPLFLMAKLDRCEETIFVFHNPRGVKKADHCKGLTTYSIFLL